MPNPFDKSGTATADPAPAAEAAPAAAAAPPAKKAPARNGRTKAAGKAEGGDGFDSVDAEGKHAPGKTGDPFSTPAGASEYKITELLTGLLLVKPTEVIDEMDTEMGRAENVVRVDVVCLEDVELHDPETLNATGKVTPTGEVLDQGTIVTDVLVFNMALQRALLRVMDGPNPYLLGRLGLGTAKKGKNAPYIFERPDEDDVALARQWVAANPQGI